MAMQNAVADRITARVMIGQNTVSSSSSSPTLVSSIVATQPLPVSLYAVTRSMTALCDSWLPWLMLSRATDMPATPVYNVQQHMGKRVVYVMS